MKLKLTTVIAFLFAGSLAYCGPSDSLHAKRVTHHFQLLIGNYAGESFLSPHPNTAKPYYAPPGQVNYGTSQWLDVYGKPSFIPMYSYSVGFDYKADLSKHIGIRTGVNYFTYGYIVQGNYDPCPNCAWDANLNVNYRRVIFVSSFHVPLQLVVYKPLNKGRFVFTAGPDIYLPINTFGKETRSMVWNESQTSTKIHYHVNGTDFFKGGSMGFSLGLGYEKVLSKKLSIELLPDIHIMNLVPFDFQGQGTSIYKNYIFNTTVGLSTYLSFSK